MPEDATDLTDEQLQGLQMALQMLESSQGHLNAGLLRLKKLVRDAEGYPADLTEGLYGDIASDWELRQELAEPPKKNYNKVMQGSTRNDLLQLGFQILGTALAVAALVVPLLQWGMDAKISEIKTTIAESDRRYELRQEESEKRLNQWQTMTKDYIDARTDKKP